MSAARDRWRAKYGPWAVVTGASDGIGREMAHCLGRAGLNVMLVARRRALLDEIAARIATDDGVETRVVAADLSRAHEVARIIAAAAELDVGLLAACAGFGTSGPLIDAPLEPELEMIDVNCRAVLALSHAFGRRFAAQGRGGLVLMSSLVAFQGVPHAANYAATKAYVQTLAEALRLELAPRGVDVVASAPGPIDSGFAARADMQMGMAQKPDAVAQTTLKALGRKTTVRPGWLAKFLEGSLAPLPRGARVRMMGTVMKGMTKHQHGAAEA